MKQVKKDLQAIVDRLEALRKKAEEMSARVGELSKAAPTQKPAGKKDVATATVMNQIIRVMRRHRAGVDVATLVKKTGFGEKKIRNTLNRALNKGKVSRVRRGVYVAL
jgi:uncharacterized coiled-coil DUF342 family protein